MTKDEALRLALEALIEVRDANIHGLTLTQDYHETIIAIKAALEAKNEPVGWKMGASGIGGTGVIVQPQRTWVSMTNEQFLEACKIAEGGNYMVAFQRIQQWLKENNT